MAGGWVAILKPSLDDLDQLVTPLNSGELCVARALSMLNDEWTVYIQPRLGQDIPDFVAVHDRYGVCVVEVKDWALRKYRQADNGAFEFRCGDTGWHFSTEMPRYQAHRYRSAIFDQFFALPNDNQKPTPAVRSVVILPQYSNEQARSLLARPSVTADEFAVEVWGGDGLKQSIEQLVRGTGCTTPRPESIQRLRRHLVQSEILAELQSPTKLSRDARNIASNPSNARVRRVRGPAGSGKSFGLAARAALLASQRKRVLVLSFNVTLSNYLRTLVTARCNDYAANPTLVTCTSFHALCYRIIDDAEHAGFQMATPDRTKSYDAAVAKAEQALLAGHGPTYDAVLIDEGQDFTLEWWNLLRHHIVTPDGEMLLVADPTQDVYEKQSWTDNQQMLDAGFSGRWTELKGSYRMPGDMVPIANAFAQRYITGERISAEVLGDHDEVVQRSSVTNRRWLNIDRTNELGRSIGTEVVRLLAENPALSPSDVVFLCEHHDDGLAAVTEVERAGYSVHHIFSKRESDRPVRKRRFWPDADGVKGCTVQSFKGWETPALVMGVGRADSSRRLAYVAMTRIAGRISGVGFLSVVNSDLTVAGFQSTFEEWAPPRAELRVF